MRVVWRGLEVPRHLAGVDLHGDDRAREEILAGAARCRGIGRRWIARAEDVEPGLGIVRAGQPGMSAAVAGRVQILPGLEAGIARLHREGVERSLHVACFRIEGLE